MSSRLRRIACYVTGHGYGHATRTSALLLALVERGRTRGLSIEVEVSSNLPEWLWSELPPGSVTVRRRKNDVGLLQRDGVAIELAATAVALEDHLATFDDDADAEARHLADGRFDLVLADIPAGPLLAAERAGLPSVAVGNFDWAFVYGAFSHPVFAAAVAKYEAVYATASVLFRLPLSPKMGAFPRVVDAPLLVRRPRRTREDVRAALGLAGDVRPLVLVTFGGLSQGPFGLAGFEETAVRGARDLVFLALGEGHASEPNVLRVRGDRFYFPDLVAAADAIVTKLGYGIVAEAVAQRTPLLYVPRHDFPEYPVIAERIGEYVPAGEVSVESLAAGAAWPELRALLARPAGASPFALDGDAVIAERILDGLA